MLTAVVQDKICLSGAINAHFLYLRLEGIGLRNLPKRYLLLQFYHQLLTHFIFVCEQDSLIGNEDERRVIRCCARPVRAPQRQRADQYGRRRNHLFRSEPPGNGEAFSKES